MNYSKKILKGILPLIFGIALIAGCKDYHELNLEPINSGEADFSTYVAVGNSLTAGFQNNALYASAQEFSYPNLIARQIRQEENFSQPLISDPGLGSGRTELANLDPIVITQTPVNGTPINQGEKPFSNLGIPGAVLVDYLNPGNSGDLKARATDPSHPAYNPFYSIVLEQSELEKPAPNIHNQVAKQEPTLITFWLGNNDVLGFVTSGGEGQPITDPANFAGLYQASGQALASTGASVVVYNIPDVTTIPFVFYLRAQLEQEGAIVFNAETQTYQLVTPQGNLDIYIETDDGIREMGAGDFPILSASTYFAQLEAGQVQPPVQPSTAIPDELILDGPDAGLLGSSELEQAAGAVLQYNTTIEIVASSFGFALVDINETFNDIFTEFQSSGGENGYQTNGLNLRPVPGELFSFDGVHPSNRGSAILANETIQVMNNSFGSNIPLIDVAKIPQGFPVVSAQAAD
ncbi:MAG TPA: SGNH/GDSL hydrolase family protein [Balneolaceae bacterium]